MRLYFNKWNKDLEFDKKKPTILIFNDLKSLFDFTTSLDNSIKKDCDDLIIFSEGKELNLEKDLEYIQDVLHLNYCSRKLINYLIKKITKEVNASSLQSIFQNQKVQIKEFLDNIKTETLFEFDYDNEYELDDLLKMMKIKPQIDYDNVYLHLNKYIELLKEATKVKLIVLKGVFDLFEIEAIRELTNYCKNHKIYLIFIEKEEFEYKSMSDSYQLFYIDNNFVL